MSSWSVKITTILMIILSGVIRAHLHFIRLALLALLGLLGLYLLHRLAQDFNRLMGSSSGGSSGGGGGGGARPPRLTSVFGLASRLFRSSISKRSVDSQVRKKFSSMICSHSKVRLVSGNCCGEKIRIIIHACIELLHLT